MKQQKREGEVNLKTRIKLATNVYPRTKAWVVLRAQEEGISISRYLNENIIQPYIKQNDPSFQPVDTENQL